MIYDIEIYAEMCCDECGDIAHNHIDCPICCQEWVETDAYGQIDYMSPEFQCECGASFKVISDDAKFWVWGGIVKCELLEK